MEVTLEYMELFVAAYLGDGTLIFWGWTETVLM